MNKVVVYTAIFGDSLKLYPQPKLQGIDFICFSDRLHVAKGWKIIVCEKIFGDDSVRDNRFYKLHPHLYFADYELSIYIDGNFILMNSPLQMIAREMKEVKLMAFNHAQNIADARDCIYQEYEALVKLYEQKNTLKDDLVNVEAMVQYLRSQNYPANEGLINGGVLIRKHNDPEVVRLMERWWYFVQHYSKRDQLSFNFVAWEQGFGFVYLPGDIRRRNPWFYMVSKNDRTLAFSLLKYRLKKVLSKLL